MFTTLTNVRTYLCWGCVVFPHPQTLFLGQFFCSFKFFRISFLHFRHRPINAFRHTNFKEFFGNVSFLQRHEMKCMRDFGYFMIITKKCWKWDVSGNVTHANIPGEWWFQQSCCCWWTRGRFRHLAGGDEFQWSTWLLQQTQPSRSGQVYHRCPACELDTGKKWENYIIQRPK